MQSSEIRRDSRVLPLILAAVVVSLILAVLMWMVASQSSGPASLSPVSNLVSVSAFRARMGDLRAVDIVNSAPADMGSPKTTQASGSFYAGMGDLKVLEPGVGSI